jgi:hypothetical protein
MCDWHGRLFSAKAEGCKVCLEGYEPRRDFGYVRSVADPTGAERNDCAVRALATGLGLPYEEVHAYLKAKGRVERKGTSAFQYDPLLKAHGYVRTHPSKYSPKHGYSRGGMVVRTFLKKHPKGTFFLQIAHHIFCVKDGVIHDTFANNLNSRVKSYWGLPA